MNCPNCGAANGAESKFCVTCGTPLTAQEPVVETPAPEAVPEAAPEVTPEAAPAEEKAGFKLDVKQILNELKTTVLSVFAPLKPYLTNKKVLIGAGATLAVLVVVSILCAIFLGGNGYIPYKTSIMPMANGDGYKIIVNNKVISDSIETQDVSGTYTSIDGSVMTVIAEYENGDNELFVIKGNKLISVAEDVADVILSVTGKGLAYAVENEDPEDEAYYSLYLYNVGNGKTTTVTEEMRNLRFAIAPDGGSVTYYVPGDENPELMYFKGSKETKVTSSDVTLCGMANNGKFIYATEEKESDDGVETILYAYNTKGEKEKLGKISSSSYYFNYEHTQILFFNDGKSYIATNGKEAVKASSDRISLIVAPNASTFYDDLSYTYPVKNLYDHVYAVSGDSTSAWIIKKNSDKNIKLVSKISDYTLDKNAEYLYYTYDGEELRVIKLSDGENAGEKAVTLVDEAVDNYVVTSDAKKVYYVLDDGLYVVNGTKGGKATTIASDDVGYALAINAKNVVYYNMDGDMYATTGGKGTKVLTDYEGMTDSPNGYVYALADEKLYVTNGNKKLTKILDIE